MTYNFYGRMDTDAVFAAGIDMFIRWRIQLMEKAILLLDFEKIEAVTQVISSSLQYLDAFLSSFIDP